MLAALLALVELVLFVLVANWIGLGLTILATLATSALGAMLLARQGMQALSDVRDRAQARQPAGRELGDAGLIAIGGLLMVLPGFLGDLIGLLCLLPATRPLPRAVGTRLLLSRLPDRVRGPVRVRSARSEPVYGGSGATRATPLVIEGEVVRDSDGQPRI
jgi:UPF0716 protein FxsA